MLLLCLLVLEALAAVASGAGVVALLSSACGIGCSACLWCLCFGFRRASVLLQPSFIPLLKHYFLPFLLFMHPGVSLWGPAPQNRGGPCPVVGGAVCCCGVGGASVLLTRLLMAGIAG